MHTRWFLLIGLSIILSSIILSAVLTSIYDAEFSPSQSEQEPVQCNSLEYNGDDKLNILFFSDKRTAAEYSDFLLSSSPFEKQKEEFNFLNINEVPECETYQGQAILCYSRELIKKAASCSEVDYITVLSDKDSGLRSSAYLNVMSLNTNHPKTVFLHEFGHALANLAEEYVPADLPRNSRNCVSQCSDFSSDIDGCFEGCSREDYRRSIDRGVMRTLSSKNFGKLNEKILLEKLSSKTSAKITGSQIKQPSECSESSYYLIEGTNKNGEIKITDKTLETGCPLNLQTGDLTYSVFSKNEEIVSSGNINTNFFTDVQQGEVLTGETFQIEQFFLTIPAFSQADNLKIFDNNQQLTQTSLYDVGARPCQIN